jgi:transcriptional regulator with XRE-family HTH domain
MSEMTPRLCKAARVLLNWEIKKLAEISGVSDTTISRYEREEDKEDISMSVGNAKKIRRALEGAGIEFLGNRKHTMEGVCRHAPEGEELADI